MCASIFLRNIYVRNIYICMSMYIFVRDIHMLIYRILNTFICFPLLVMLGWAFYFLLLRLIRAKYSVQSLRFANWLSLRLKKTLKY